MGSGTREHLAHLQTQLVEQQRRTQDLEDLLRSQAKQASVQMGLQQVHQHYIQNLKAVKPGVNMRVLIIHFCIESFAGVFFTIDLIYQEYFY